MLLILCNSCIVMIIIFEHFKNAEQAALLHFEILIFQKAFTTAKAY